MEATYFLLEIFPEITILDPLELQIFQLDKVGSQSTMRKKSRRKLYADFMIWLVSKGQTVLFLQTSKEAWPSLETYSLKVPALIFNDEKRTEYKEIILKCKSHTKWNRSINDKKRFTKMLPLDFRVG